MFSKFFMIAFLSFTIVSCTSTDVFKPTTVETSNLFYDQAFSHYNEVEIESEQQIFALDKDMKSFVAQKLLTTKDSHERAKRLLVRLFNSSSTSLRYQNGANLIAADTFRENVANCLSLTILAYALANEANLLVNFQQVDIPEYWIRQGGYNMLAGHVNLKITGDKNTAFKVIWGSNNLTIDFDPYITKQHFDKRIISKHHVTAMFYNNKAAQAITRNEYNVAYAYLKKSIKTDETLSASWANLGLLYKKVGLESLAEKSYLAALNINNKNYNTWTNLAILFSEQGKDKEAKEIYSNLTAVRLKNPYYHALLGDEAFYNGDYNIAIKHFKKAKDMNNKEDVFYFGLAKAYFKLGDYEASKYYLLKAKRNSTFSGTRLRYQSKLDVLTKL